MKFIYSNVMIIYPIYSCSVLTIAPKFAWVIIAEDSRFTILLFCDSYQNFFKTCYCVSVETSIFLKHSYSFGFNDSTSDLITITFFCHFVLPLIPWNVFFFAVNIFSSLVVNTPSSLITSIKALPQIFTGEDNHRPNNQ